MQQAPLVDGVAFDPFPCLQDGLATSEVDIGRCEIAEAFVVAPVIVVIDEGAELRFEGAGFEEGAVYRAAFRDDAGRLTPAGEFLGTGAEEMVCNLQSALLRDAATAVVVTDDSGETVLSAAL